MGSRKMTVAVMSASVMCRLNSFLWRWLHQLWL